MRGNLCSVDFYRWSFFFGGWFFRLDITCLHFGRHKKVTKIIKKEIKIVTVVDRIVLFPMLKFLNASQSEQAINYGIFLAQDDLFSRTLSITPYYRTEIFSKDLGCSSALVSNHWNTLNIKNRGCKIWKMKTQKLKT